MTLFSAFALSIAIRSSVGLNDTQSQHPGVTELGTVGKFILEQPFLPPRIENPFEYE
jgi:hypothetical protein